MRFLTIFLLCMLLAPVQAQNASVETLSGGNGWINWDRQVVKAVGHGLLPGDAESPEQAALMAQAAARADAYRNLAAMINGVRVEGETHVKNFVTQSDEVRTKVQGLISGAQVVSEKQLSDRSFEVILQVSLAGDGGLMSSIAEKILPKDGSAVNQDGPGLVIDARGLGVKPAMSPKIYDEEGKEVYGTVNVSPEFAIESGIAVYPSTLEQAMKSPRVGKNALVVKAIRRGSKHVSDIVISNADAERIRKAEAETGMLTGCHVAIVVGK